MRLQKGQQMAWKSWLLKMTRVLKEHDSDVKASLGRALNKLILRLLDK